jgi:hypothetical protein
VRKLEITTVPFCFLKFLRGEEAQEDDDGLARRHVVLGPEGFDLLGLAQAAGAHDNASKVGALTIDIKMLCEMLDTVREDRDAWRDQAGKVTAVLPAPAPIAEKRRGRWRRLAG